jgi:hypothetical protein
MARTHFVLAGWLVLTMTPAALPADDAVRTIADTTLSGDVDPHAMRLTLSLLPRPPVKIAVVKDGDLPGVMLEHVAGLDAFVLAGDSTIYLRHQSRTLREAERRIGAAGLMLAVVIWHEMAHAEGFDEREARLREEELWLQFIRQGRLDPAVGLEYLRELRARN